MVLRTGPLTREQWKERIEELLIDIGKETDEYADEIYEMLIDDAIQAKDDREDVAREDRD